MTCPRAMLFIESNTSGTGRLFVAAARRLGHAPFLVTASPQKYRYLWEPDAPEVIPVSRPAEEDIVEAIGRRFPGGGGIAGVTSSSEYFIATAAAVASRLGLPGADPAKLLAARDKEHQRNVLSAAGLPMPSYRPVRSGPDAVAAACEIGFPVVVKPVDGTGSIGVRACHDKGEVARHADSLFAQATKPGCRLLVESLIAGDEFSVEAFQGCVVGITRKHLGAAPSFVEVGHDYPARIAPSIAVDLTAAVMRATSALGLEWGPAHWELRVQDGVPHVIEVNPRLAGGFIPELVRHAEGIDLIRDTLRLVAGEDPNPRPLCRKFASIRFLLAPAAGTLESIEGLDEARALKHSVEAVLYRSIGDTLAIRGDFGDRIGHVISCAVDASAAAAAADSARDMIRIGTRPHSSCNLLESAVSAGHRVAR